MHLFFFIAITIKLIKI